MLDFALRAKALAEEIAEPAGIAAANSMVGVSHHLIGNQGVARAHLEAALVRLPVPGLTKAVDFGFHPERAQIALTRTLWLLGYPDQAVRLARRAVNEPAATEPVSSVSSSFGAFASFAGPAIGRVAKNASSV
jgi:hypothetical protein